MIMKGQAVNRNLHWEEETFEGLCQPLLLVSNPMISNHLALQDQIASHYFLCQCQLIMLLLYTHCHTYSSKCENT